MTKFLQVLLLLILVSLVGLFVFLATWDMPRPTTPIEKVVPDDRIGR